MPYERAGGKMEEEKEKQSVKGWEKLKIKMNSQWKREGGGHFFFKYMPLIICFW